MFDIKFENIKYAFEVFDKKHWVVISFVFFIWACAATYKFVDSYRATEVKVDIVKAYLKTSDSLCTEYRVAHAELKAQVEMYKKIIENK